jgi:hypothetical protein
LILAEGTCTLTRRGATLHLAPRIQPYIEY